MKHTLPGAARFGFARAAVDAHTLGIGSVEQLLQECGFDTVIADAAICEACGEPLDPKHAAAIERWVRTQRLSVLAFSHRLDPEAGVELLAKLVRQLKNKRLLVEQGGPLHALYFAGLPRTCEMVRARIPEVAGVFPGGETPAETLRILGLDPRLLPRELAEGAAYDEARLAFGTELIRKGAYHAVRPVVRPYAGVGTRSDTVLSRLEHGRQQGLPPLMRAHVGPYLDDRVEAVKLFLGWTRQLAASGMLDVLSIGTSQLTQSNFGEPWGDKLNGGGVPLNSPEEFEEVWKAARPMLVRTYAGTRNIPALARMYEETIHMAWHALSFWWFCRIDGRGPYSVLENLEQHIQTLKYLATTGKPFEPNIPHHFSFRGADDVTYVTSAVLAAKTAKALGVRHLILQVMLNTPKSTWGVQDLAKARALLALTRELEEPSFRVILQPRGGLDYFSSDLNSAKAQLAAVTALMDDIEPNDPASPQIVHVVSYSEASHLADPPTVDESIRITRHALHTYRQLRAKGLVDDMARHPEAVSRTEELIREARALIEALEAMVPSPYTAAGLYKVFAWGFLPAPYLWEGREEFAGATQWQTRLVRGSVRTVGAAGKPLSVGERIRLIAAQHGIATGRGRTKGWSEI